MDVGILHRTYLELLSSLFSEGILNEQFTTLHKLQDRDDPNFVFRTVSLFFDNAERLINEIGSNLNQPTVEFNKIKELVHQLKGSNKLQCLQIKKSITDSVCDLSSLELISNLNLSRALIWATQIIGMTFSEDNTIIIQKNIGGQRIEDACVALRSFCDANDLQGCFSSMQQLNQEFLNFKSKLDTLFMMEQQIVAAGGSIPKME